MNERIRELAEQAGEYVNEVYTPPVRSKTPGKIWEDGHVDWHIQFNQKFAELIIQECIGKKEWVGLTDEERHNIREWQEIQKELGPVWAPMMLYLYLAIEQALKEKNHG